MIGNVWEWVKGEVDGNYDGKTLPASDYITAVNIKGMPLATDGSLPNENFNQDYFWIKETGTRGIARGGYWDNSSDAGIYSMYLVTPTSFAGIGISFRCVR